jgi:hypothetical protein
MILEGVHSYNFVNRFEEKDHFHWECTSEDVLVVAGDVLQSCSQDYMDIPPGDVEYC